MLIKLLTTKKMPLDIIFRINSGKKIIKPSFHSFNEHFLKGKCISSPHYFAIQRRYVVQEPKDSDIKARFIYQGIAKCLNTVDAVTSTKDYKLAKKSLEGVGSWLKMAYEEYFLKHWWVQHTIKEFNRKLAEARFDRALKE